MNCPSCGAPMRLKTDLACFKCEYCQSVYFPEKDDDGVRVTEEQSDLDCPVCTVPLRGAVVATTHILYCTQCHGMRIPMGLFEQSIEQMRSQLCGASTASAPPVPADKADLTRKINCPQCHRRMETYYYGGPGNVVIDSCEQCGFIWLDRGELNRIARAANVPPVPTFQDSLSDSAPEFTGQSRVVAAIDAIDALFS